MLLLVHLRMMVVLPLRWKRHGSCPGRASLRLDKQTGRVGRLAGNFGVIAWVVRMDGDVGVCLRCRGRLVEERSIVFVGIPSFLVGVFAGLGLEDGYILLWQELERTWVAIGE